MSVTLKRTESPGYSGPPLSEAAAEIVAGGWSVAPDEVDAQAME